MPAVSSAKDKNTLGIVAMTLGLEDEGSILMTSPGSVQVPHSLEQKLEEAAKGKSKSLSVQEAKEIQMLLRKLALGL
jgi:hypothetical protein